MMNLPYYEFYFPEASKINGRVVAAYRVKREAGQVRKTHLFGGRYENIYIDREEISGIDALIPFWLSSAAQVLDKEVSDLRCGFWFNDMQPGDVTQPHSHNDDDDEWLSGVYYLKVPIDSGDLVLHDESGTIIVQPQPGKLVLFSSGNVHEVRKNCSQESRLSIGINFGCNSKAQRE